MRCLRTFLCPAAVLLAAPVAFPQSVGALIQEGDPIPGVGRLSRVEGFLAVTDSKSWRALVETDLADPTRDLALLRDGWPLLMEAAPLALPPGASLDEWRSLRFTASGAVAMLVLVRTPPGIQREGLYWNLTKLLLEGDVISAPGLGVGTTWDRGEVVETSGDGLLLVLAEVNNPAVAGPREDALFRLQVDPAGNLEDLKLLATKGQFLPALGAVIDTLGTSTAAEHGLASNSRGDFIVPVNGVGRRAITRNLDTILAEEGAPAPVPGRNWNTNAFALARVALNERGEFAFSGVLQEQAPGDATTFLIVKNGQKFAQSGDVLPSLSPHPLAKGTPVIALSNQGDLFWRASATMVDEAFMRNDTPVVQKDRTVVGGNVVITIAGGDHCFAISPEGRFFIGKVELQSVGTAVVFVDFGLIRERPGCSGHNAGALRHLSGEARLGQRVELGMDDGPGPGALPIVLFSRHPRLSPGGCGALVPYGELMLAAPIAQTLVLAPWDGTNPSVLAADIPSSLALVDAVFYAQGVFRDTGTPSRYRLTNALQIEIGPP